MRQRPLAMSGRQPGLSRDRKNRRDDAVTDTSGMPVILNVYDIASPDDPALIPNINSWTIFGGVGIFHSGVEIQGREYCYGGHDEPTTGVFEVPPRNAPDAKFRQAIIMGHCELDQASISQLIDSFSVHWPGNKYNLLARNCNHFASELCQALTGRIAPAWINRLAWMGEKAKFLLPAGFDTPTRAPVTAEAAARANGVGSFPSTDRQRADVAEAAAVIAEVRAAAAAASIDLDEDLVHVDRDDCGRSSQS